MDKTKEKQHTSTEQKQTEKKVSQGGFKEALISDNEEYDNEE